MNNNTGSQSLNVQRGYRAEALIEELFKRLDYRVRREVRVQGLALDLVIERDGASSPVEVITGRVTLERIRANAARLQVALAHGMSSPLLIAFGRVTANAQAWAQSQYGLRIWDFDTVLEKTQPFPDIRQEILEEFSDEAASTQQAPSANAQNEGEQLIRELIAHQHNNTLSPSEYENLCMRAFTHVFDPHLYGFKRQAQTTDGANRYDFICRIKSGNAFWDSIRTDFRTKAILFECKNYNDKITADQIYSTERYLFAGALRTVCFLISRLGPNDGCIRAAQGAMRESGKLILLLSNTDLIEMIKLKSQDDGPENYVDEKIWNFIISLPR